MRHQGKRMPYRQISSKHNSVLRRCDRPNIDHRSLSDPPTLEDRIYLGHFSVISLAPSYPKPRRRMKPLLQISPNKIVINLDSGTAIAQSSTYKRTLKFAGPRQLR